MTPYCDLIWSFPFGQQGKVSSGVFAYIDKPGGTLCPKSAHTLKKISLRTPVYKNLFWSIKNSGEILNKLKSRGFLASGLSTYDFSTLYTTLPHNLIKEKLTELIEQTFKIIEGGKNGPAQSFPTPYLEESFG